MKHLLVFLASVIVLAMPTPAHAQDCTPPLDASLITTNINGQFTAWAVGNAVTWCGHGRIITSYEGSTITLLYFDGFALPYNLYWGSDDGYLFQMNVATGTGYLISPHGQPAGDPGEAHGQTIGVNPTVEPTPTPSPVVRRAPVKPRIIVRFRLAGLWQ